MGVRNYDSCGDCSMPFTLCDRTKLFWGWPFLPKLVKIIESTWKNCHTDPQIILWAVFLPPSNCAKMTNQRLRKVNLNIPTCIITGHQRAWACQTIQISEIQKNRYMAYFTRLMFLESFQSKFLFLVFLLWNMSAQWSLA